MVKKNTIKYIFEGWITLELPETWLCEQDEDVLNIFSTVNPKGAIQISFYNVDLKIIRDELAEDFLEKFIEQFDIEVDINTKMVIERDDYTISMCSGFSEGRFLKIWCLAENNRILLATYNSEKKNREVNTADDIIFGIQFI